MQEYYDNIDKRDPRKAVVVPKVDDEDISRFGTMILAFISIILVLVTLPFSLCYCVKVVQEYERAVIFRLGRLKKGGASGPGLFFILPCIDKYSCVDLRTVSYEVPPQEMLSRDSVTVSVDAVCFYKVTSEYVLINILNFICSLGVQPSSCCMQCWSLHTLYQPISSHKLEECPRYKGEAFIRLYSLNVSLWNFRLWLRFFLKEK